MKLLHISFLIKILILVLKPSITKSSSTTKPKGSEKNPYSYLTKAIKYRFEDNEKENIPISKILSSISKTQSTFKTLDGISHETYQRSLSSSSTNVKGRATRHATRLGSIADSFFALELLDSTQLELSERSFKILHNITLSTKNKKNKPNINLSILLDESYKGVGGCSDHGGINSLLLNTTETKKRILVIIKDSYCNDLIQLVNFLDNAPKALDKSQVFVHTAIYEFANEVIEELNKVLETHKLRNITAFHFVGYSISGAIAGLSSCIGNEDISSVQNTTFLESKCSAVCIAPPPCLSSTYPQQPQDFDYITTIIHGDDILPRLSKSSIDALCQRIERKHSSSNNFLSKNLNWITDTYDMTLSSSSSSSTSRSSALQQFASPKTFLIRPRRLHGGSSSIHEISDNLRTRILFQMNQVLISKSFWRHHKFENYIQALDKVPFHLVEQDS